MIIEVGDVVEVSSHSYFLDDWIGTVISKDYDVFDVCIHNAYGTNDSHILSFNTASIFKVVHPVDGSDKAPTEAGAL